jgi:hypothetical protein
MKNKIEYTKGEMSKVKIIKDFLSYSVELNLVVDTTFNAKTSIKH